MLLREYGYDCMGLDKDGEVIDYAKKLTSGVDIKFIVADILGEFPEGIRNRFDLVMVKHLSLSLTDTEKALIYARSSLKDDGPKLIIIDFLIKRTEKPKESISSVDSYAEDSLQIVRLNQMERSVDLDKYNWQEVYFLKQGGTGPDVKVNNRTLWFFAPGSVEELLDKVGISVMKTSSEEVGINGLSGLTIYGKFRK